MELILIRHGQAQAPGENLEDARRTLTSEGRKKLNRTLPSLGLLVKNLGKAQIWSSPLDRAVQTADILARIFHVTDIQRHEFVGSGDFVALCQQLSITRPSSTILIVGHEPHLGDWSRQLCGLQLPFKKGSAAGLKISSLTPLDSELLWFFQPQPFGRLSETLFNNRFHPD
jgi:phosphohistidine phosphatase